MMQSVRGIYRDGKVELIEPLSGIIEGEVIVTFVAAKPENQPSRMIRLGMFSSKKTDRTSSTEADFKMAEFQGDGDDSLDWT